MKPSLQKNRIIAITWITLAAIAASIGIYILFTPGKYLTASFLGLSGILFYYGRQRLTRYQLEPIKFKTIVRNYSLFVVFTSAIGTAVSANAQQSHAPENEKLRPAKNTEAQLPMHSSAVITPRSSAKPLSRPT